MSNLLPAAESLRASTHLAKLIRNCADRAELRKSHEMLLEGFKRHVWELSHAQRTTVKLRRNQTESICWRLILVSSEDFPDEHVARARGRKW
jgi:hypothetical protein